VAAAAAAASTPMSPPQNSVVRWNQIANDAAAAANTDPLTESRVFAILQLAVHDSLNAIEPRAKTYLAPARPTSGGAVPVAGADAAVAAAAHAVLVDLLPAGRAAFDSALAEGKRASTQSPAEAAGARLGREVAASILAARRNDGAAREVKWPAGTKPGEYRPTPPDLTPAFMAQWGGIAPFALESPGQLRPSPPPAVDGPTARAESEEIRRLGGEWSAERSEEQSEISRYWYENSTQGWNRIARNVAMARHLDPWETARLLALVNVAMADGFIAGFEAKYHYNYWRPSTAIRAGLDREWLNFLPTPPVPDYPSTHTVLGAAAATAMARYFGTDFVSFGMTSGAPFPNIHREFWSLSQAARENGASRCLAGIHFPSAVDAGYKQGEQVGDWVYDHALQPLTTTNAAGGAKR
jgi:hypothetical protein